MSMPDPKQNLKKALEDTLFKKAPLDLLKKKVDLHDEGIDKLTNDLKEIELTPGPQGEQGIQGEKGDTGDIGPEGPVGLSGIKGEKGDTIKGPQGPSGKAGTPGTDGSDGIDGRVGADGSQGPAGKNGSPDTAIQVRDKLSSLKKDERLDKAAIKGLEKLINQDILDRAISILDSRTSFLINKVNNLPTSGGSGTLAQTLALGNTTGANNIVVSTGQKVIGQTDLLLSHANGNNYYYAGPNYLFQQWYDGLGLGNTDYLLQGNGTQLFSHTSIDIQSDTGKYGFYEGTARTGTLDFTNIASTDKTFVFPNASGTIALTSGLASYVPYTGATGDVNLGDNDLQIGANLSNPGNVLTISLNNGGTGYANGDIISLTNGDGAAWVNVDTTAGGVITAVSLIANHWGSTYSVATSATTAVTGTGNNDATINVLTVGRQDTPVTPAQFLVNQPASPTQSPVRIIGSDGFLLFEIDGAGRFAVGGPSNQFTVYDRAVNAINAADPLDSYTWYVNNNILYINSVTGGIGNVFELDEVGNLNLTGKLGLYEPTFTYRALLNAANITTSDKTFTFPDASGTFALTSNIPTSASLLSSSIALTAQVADITDTAFTVNTAGLYRIQFYMLNTTADITAGAVTLNIKFTDNSGAKTISSSPVLLTATTSYVQGQVIARLNSGNLTWGVTHSGIFGTSVFALYVTQEKLQ